MVTTSLKLPEEMLRALVAISSIETLRRGKRTTWASLVRDTVTKHLIEPNHGLVTTNAPSK